MHEGRGVERVKWHLGIPTAKFLEESVDFWIDPGAGDGNKKQSIVDLTKASSITPLNNTQLSNPRKSKGSITFSASGAASIHSGDEVASLADMDSYRKSLKAHLNLSKKKDTIRDLAERSTRHDSDEASSVDIHTRLDPLHDLEAGESTRAETCIVNAAIMANSWGGPKRFNKPIVVDVLLPVWNEYEDFGE
jgi:hypothetical protein